MVYIIIICERCGTYTTEILTLLVNHDDLKASYILSHHGVKHVPYDFLAPAVTVGDTEGAMDSTSFFFGLFFCL